VEISWIFFEAKTGSSAKIYGNIDLENYTATRTLIPIVSNNYKRRLLLLVFTIDVARAAAVEEI
jgi:hypothetical protein